MLLLPLNIATCHCRCVTSWTVTTCWYKCWFSWWPQHKWVHTCQWVFVLVNNPQVTHCTIHCLQCSVPLLQMCTNNVANNTDRLSRNIQFWHMVYFKKYPRPYLELFFKSRAETNAKFRVWMVKQMNIRIVWINRFTI